MSLPKSTAPLPSPSSSRLLHVDALKALAAQAIVLHHLAAYGPVAETVQALLPGLIAALYDYGRMAVQVFLVVGGFLSARGLAPGGRLLSEKPLALLGRRYLRLALPFFAAVLLTLACSSLVARWLPELVPASVGAGQLLAHLLLLHGVLGHESLTVGAWYVAIDLQLFALLLGLLWLARGWPRVRALGPALVLAVAMASLWVFNLDADGDIWAPYFFGAYGLGALVHWAGRSQWRGGWLLLLSALVVSALLFEFRGRIALAGGTALALAWLQQRHDAGLSLIRGPRLGALVGHLGTHSYALFLIHFPICLLVNALFEHKDPEHALAALAAMLGAWLLSNLAAVAFYRWIESPAGRLRLALPRLSRA